MSIEPTIGSTNETEPAKEPAAWSLYLLECKGGVFYSGIAIDVQARFEAHCRGKGAKFTRANPPKRILISVVYANRSEASKAEWALKKLPKARKLACMQAGGPL